MGIFTSASIFRPFFRQETKLQLKLAHYARNTRKTTKGQSKRRRRKKRQKEKKERKEEEEETEKEEKKEGTEQKKGGDSLIRYETVRNWGAKCSEIYDWGDIAEWMS